MRNCPRARKFVESEETGVVTREALLVALPNPTRAQSSSMGGVLANTLSMPVR